jgi:hypothetical protein
MLNTGNNPYFFVSPEGDEVRVALDARRATTSEGISTSVCVCLLAYIYLRLFNIVVALLWTVPSCFPLESSAVDHHLIHGFDTW